VVFGGPPCQGFSLIGKRNLHDDRNDLIFHFYRLVMELNPRYFVMENVPGMALGEHKMFLRQLVSKFESAGYHVRMRILNAADFGVPQSRKRLFVLGTQEGMLPLSFPSPPVIRRVTVGDAIADLPDLEIFPELVSSDEVLLTDEQLEHLHLLASPYVQMLRSYPSPKARNFSYPRLWNPEWLTSSMRTHHGEETRSRFAATLANEIEPISHLRRLDVKGLCHTLRAGTDATHGSHTSPRPIHPTKARVISVREAARLHSFPDWFRFHHTKWHGFRQVGNAVPPLLASAIGKKITASLCINPTVPKIPLVIGDTQLLRFDTSDAASYWQGMK
jgi:DNA (cytosine-5)-methyltransferase 1